MSDDKKMTTSAGPLWGIWIAMFVMLKVTGVQAAWSWWWLLMPIVPSLAWVFEKVGWL